MQNLSSETFKSVKELAEIQRQIMTGKAEIEALRSTKDTFIAEREAEVVKIVDNVLTASREALVEADQNRDAIMALLTVVTDMVEDAKEMHADLHQIVEQYEGATNKTVLVIKDRTEQLESAIKVLKQQRATLKDDESALEVARTSLARDRILVADKNKTLITELARIKSTKL